MRGPIIFIPVLLFGLLPSCTPQGKGVPIEGLFLEKEISHFGVTEFVFTFPNSTAEPIPLPQIRRDCGCVTCTFNGHELSPHSNTTLTIGFPVARRGAVLHQVHLTWDDQSETTLGVVVKGSRIQGIEVSTDGISIAEWRRNGRLRIAFYADYFPNQAPIVDGLDHGPCVYLGARPLVCQLLHRDSPIPGAFSGELLLECPGHGDMDAAAQSLTVAVSGLQPTTIPLLP